MKKNLLLLAALVCCTLALTACGSDDEPKEKTVASATYSITFSEDLVKAGGPIILYYKGTNNETKREIVTGTSWTKTISSEKFPAEFGYKLDLSAADVSDLTADSYALSYDAQINVSVLKGTSTVATRVVTDAASTTVTDKNKVADAVKRFNKDLGIRVTKDGTITTGVNLDYKVN